MQTLQKYDPHVIEILKNRLYWSSNEVLVQDPNFLYFSVDDQLVYNPLHYDFGPVDLGKVYRFTQELLKVLNNPKFSHIPLVYYTKFDHKKRANAAFLMCAFQVIVYKVPAEIAWKPFSKLHHPLLAFRDASNNRESTFPCTILDCLRGLEYAIKLKWFSMETFDLKKYEHYSELDHGDINWIIPNKFYAFSEPFSTSFDRYGNRRMTPHDYIPIFKKLNISKVIRLNNKGYFEDEFKRQNIDHMDLFFEDGSCPNQEIINTFLAACEREPRAIAVHCKAGLGRTGTLIGCYAMKHYKFAATDFIGWIRLCRPGSILGPQQQFLVDIEPYLHSLSAQSKIYPTVKLLAEQHHRTITDQRKFKARNSMSDHEKRIARFGEYSQGNYLLEAKDRLKRSFQIPSDQALVFTPNQSFLCPSTTPLFPDDDIPQEVERTVNRILLSRHDCASRGHLARLSSSYLSCKTIA